MTSFVETPDGVRIAYDREGSGQPVILVGGANQWRALDPATRALTTALAGRGFDVVHYDRPGRGESTGEPPFTLAGEVAAIRVLVDLVGGRAALYGSSSGAVICLAAAAELRGVERLVLWEVPIDAEGGNEGADYLASIRESVRAGDREETQRRYMDGMPPEWFESMRNGPDWPEYERMAATLEADAEALAWAQSAPRARLWGHVTAPTVVLVGSTAFPFFHAAADSIVASMPHAVRAELAGADHRWEPADLTETLASHLRTPV